MNFLLLIFFTTISISGHAQESVFNIYIDADFSNHGESSESIERGLKVAFSKNNNTLLNRKLVYIRKDHRGNSARSKRHIKQYLKDPNALFMVSGIHSPPILAHRNFINVNKVLFFVPWAAAGPITRYPSEKNWIYRLSIDDSKAGDVIINFAIKKKKYKRPYLILENTGWGNSNKKTMTKALKNLGINDFKISRFDWNLKESGARNLVKQAIKAKSDVIIIVCNTIEGKLLTKTIAEETQTSPIPVVSHWGIIGGDFHEHVPHSIRDQIKLHFIQTKFSFIQKKLDKYEQEVFNIAKDMYPSIKDTKGILAPTGFIHAHDLALLINEASKKISKQDNIELYRNALRESMENINTNVRGLIKIYKKPFSRFSNNNNDAHEALNINDFKMAYFGPDNEIILVNK